MTGDKNKEGMSGFEGDRERRFHEDREEERREKRRE